MASLPSSLLLLLSTLLWGSRARAQIAPDCPDDVSWLDNSQGQDPCHVVSELYAQCLDVDAYNLTALGDTYSAYSAPQSTDSSWWTMNGCLCSMPVYGLVMACQSACQGKNTMTWQTWTGNCNSSFTGSEETPTLYFPQPVPPETELPPWTFINFSTHPWNQQEVAANVSDAMHSSISRQETATGTVGTSGAMVNPTTTPAGRAGGDEEHGSKSNAGAIAGGVIGGLAVLAIIAGGGFYILRRSQRTADIERAASAAPSGSQGMEQLRSPDLYGHPSATGSGTPTTSHWGGPHSSFSGWPGTTSGSPNPFTTPSPRPDSTSEGRPFDGMHTLPADSRGDLSEPDTYPAFRKTERAGSMSSTTRPGSQPSAM